MRNANHGRPRLASVNSHFWITLKARMIDLWRGDDVTRPSWDMVARSLVMK